MKSIKIITLFAIGISIYSCSSSKSTTAQAPAPVATETPKTIELTPELAEGKMLYENNCGKCHKLFSPTSKSKEKWGPIVDRMAPKAKLTDAQKSLVYNYVVAGL